MKAVIDRFEGSFAVLLVGKDEVRVDLPRKLLPGGAQEGSWIDITLGLDQSGELKQREHIEGLLDKLKRKQRPPG